MTTLPSVPPVPPAPARRAWVKRAIVIFLVVANVAVFGTLGAIWWAARSVSSAVSTIPASDLPLVNPPSSLTEPRTFLLIGSDSRENLPDDFERFGDVGGRRADVIMLMKIMPREDRIELLSIPRDLKITTSSGTQKINATFSTGPGEIVSAVSEVTGIPINHYVQVEFGGFAAIVDAIGGIRMTFPYPARDLKSHFEVGAGEQLLDGKTALAIARSRHYEELRPSGWVSVDANDIGRTRRQQDILLSILTQVDRPSSLGEVEDLINALGGFVVVDNAFDEDEIVQLAWEMRNIDADKLDAATLPVIGLSEGGVSYVTQQEPDATRMLEAFAAGDPLATSTDSRIEVQNGNGVAGAAGRIAEQLESRGFEVVSTGDSGRSDYAITQVVVRPVDLPLAAEIIAQLGFGEAILGGTPEGVEAVVIVGLDEPPG